MNRILTIGAQLGPIQRDGDRVYHPEHSRSKRPSVSSA
ncbi:MAG: hypothetical protein JWQ17_4995 [Tardiphaga sp.]|jgi:hypothetical protein|nr:hypothetical protein [Tardiphaga sp.]